jgi:integrase
LGEFGTSTTRCSVARLPPTGGLPWVTIRTFRRSVATLLDEPGLTARQIADQLGHSKVSTTQDVYMGRRVTSRKAADALESIRRSE